MSTKSKLLALLEEHKGSFVSGEAVATDLGISRAAIWKAVKSLKAQGLSIESVPGAGYRLDAGSDVLTAEGVTAYLPESGAPVRVLTETDSTNLEAKRWALSGAPHGAMVLAQSQTAGRGRLGRSFESPTGGLYLSMVLRPKQQTNAALMMTTAAAAVSVCKAVSRLCGIELGIKWVNDLYWQEGKCCGILTEAVTNMETGAIDLLVVGIGLNYTTPLSALPPQLAGNAASLFPEGEAPVSRAQLAAAINAEMLAQFEQLPQRGFLLEYRTRSIVPGREVTVMENPPWQAKAVGIDGEGRLMLQKPEGDVVALSFGEISVRI